MNDITQGMKFEIDVKSGLVEMPQRAVLMKGDKNANRVTMALYDGEKAVSLEGATVTGTYVLAGIKMPLLGDADGNEATIILPDECYSASGRYELRLHVTLGSVKRTFLFITGYVESDGEGGTLDVEGVIPNIDDIIAQYDEMKRVTQETKEAANAANEAASRAPYVGANGNWFVWNAASGSYIDSGSKAQGPEGPQGPAGAEIDNTLTQSGKAADAKVTGDALNQLSQQIAEKYALKTELPSLKWVLVGKSYGEAVSVPECDEVMLYVTATDEATYAFNSVILPYFAFQDSYIPMRIFIRGGYATITCSNGKVTLAHVLLDGVDVTQTSIVNVYAR